MTESQLKSLLEANALECYYDILINEKLCDENIWDTVTEEDLSKIGITVLGDRKQLLKIMREANKPKLEEPTSPPAPTTGSSNGHAALIIVLFLLGVGLLVFWMAGGTYHAKEATATFERGAYNKGAEKAYSAAVSFFKSLDSTPADAKFDSFSEATITEKGKNFFEVNMEYTYTKDGIHRSCTCTAFMSLDSKNNWRVGYHFPEQ